MTPTPPAEDGSGAGTVILLLMFAAYFFPAIVASMRSAASSGLIFFTNLVIGWTGIGWLVCLLWAGIGQTKAQRDFYESARDRRSA